MWETVSDLQDIRESDTERDTIFRLVWVFQWQILERLLYIRFKYLVTSLILKITVLLFSVPLRYGAIH